VCLRFGARAVAERAGSDTTIVPPGWQRVVILTAGPGTRLAADDDLDAYEPTDGYWICPAHSQ
jgi:hypothetical protein